MESSNENKDLITIVTVTL